jgi:hypothetical protein
MPDIAEKLIFVEDTDTAEDRINEIKPLVEDALRSNPTLLRSLEARGEKHGGDPISYTAAHIIYQDTPHLDLVRVAGKQEIFKPERVISVGCLQEKLFFAARLAVRSELEPTELMPSVQIFSLHSSAPYFVSQGGEQLLGDAIATRSIDFTSPNPSSQRDLQHFEQILTRKQHNE